MKKIEDERILSEKRRINSSAFSIALTGLWAILIFRQFILNQNMKEYVDIYFLTIGVSIYVLINNVFKGLYLTYRTEKRQNRIRIISTIVGTISFTVVNIVMGDYNMKSAGDILMILITTLIFVAFWWMSQTFLIRASSKMQNKDLEE